MSVDNIVNKILKDAEQKANQNMLLTEQKAQEAKDKTLAKAQNQAQEILQKADFDVQEVQKRQNLIAELENRKRTLAVKREMLDKVFNLAQEKLSKLPEDKWQALITKHVLIGCQTGREKLCVPSVDKEKYTGYFLSKLNDALKAAGKDGMLTLLDKQADFDGGVVVVGQDSDYDASFSAMINNIRSECEKIAADMLFDAEV